MAEARGRLEWAQTADVMAMLYNCNRTKDMPAKSGDDFNPYKRKANQSREEQVMMVPLAALKDIFKL